MYIKNDDLADKIEEKVDEDYHNQAAFWFDCAESKLNNKYGFVLDEDEDDGEFV